MTEQAPPSSGVVDGLVVSLANVLAVTCDRCHAKPGRPCHVWTGSQRRYRSNPHAARYERATRRELARAAAAWSGDVPTVRARRVNSIGRAMAAAMTGERTSSGGDGLLVDCPFCGDRHVHGAVGPNLGDGDGWRVPHCPDRHRAEDGSAYWLQETASADEPLAARAGDR